MTRVFIALGANLDSPEQQLNSACRALFALAKPNTFEVSSYYRSAPMGEVEQPDYVNAVATLETDLEPLALLDELQRIELEQGRQRLVRWGPRTLDLDLLLYGNDTIEIPRLTVPHYGMKERSFVLIPLAELAPELILPCGTPLQQLLTPALQSELVRL